MAENSKAENSVAKKSTAQKRMVLKIKGTQDFLDLTLFNFLITSVKKHLATYNFTEIMTPIIESVELFKRSLGVQTDVVSKEMFVIESREGSKDGAICLRPESTASTVRAFIEGGIQNTPWKVFSYGPMFRYERPQKGRYRQFNQFNIEVIGSASIAQDVQFIKMLDRLFGEALQLHSYALHINFLGCFNDRAAYKELLKLFLEKNESELCPTCIVRKDTNIMRVFDCKNAQCQALYDDAPFIAQSLCSDCDEEWRELQGSLELLSVSFSYQPKLVRGLDYYNKTVFEFVSDSLGAQNAFCGGGRYDQLVGQLGAKQDQPSIGAAMGIERVLLLLELIRDTLPIEQPPVLHMIMPMSKAQHMLALMLADVLQAHGLATDVILDGGSMKSMMRKANKLGAAFCLILGDDELHNKTVTVKNMLNSSQETIAQVDVVAMLKK